MFTSVSDRAYSWYPTTLYLASVAFWNFGASFHDSLTLEFSTLAESVPWRFLVPSSAASSRCGLAPLEQLPQPFCGFVTELRRQLVRQPFLTGYPWDAVILDTLSYQVNLHCYILELPMGTFLSSRYLSYCPHASLRFLLNVANFLIIAFTLSTLSQNLTLAGFGVLALSFLFSPNYTFSMSSCPHSL